VAEVFKKVLKVIVTLKAITVFVRVKTVTDIIYLYVRKSVIFITNQVIN
jgi:hypothetical protein